MPDEISQQFAAGVAGGSYDGDTNHFSSPGAQRCAPVVTSSSDGVALNKMTTSPLRVLPSRRASTSPTDPRMYSSYTFVNSRAITTAVSGPESS